MCRVPIPQKRTGRHSLQAVSAQQRVPMETQLEVVVKMSISAPPCSRRAGEIAKQVALYRRANSYRYFEASFAEQETGMTVWARPDGTLATLSDAELEAELRPLWWEDEASKWRGA